MNIDTNIPIIIPAYEPDSKLLELVHKLKEADLTDIIIIDDGSGKDYRTIFDELASKYHCTVLKHAVNLGKGRALKDAFNFILNRDEKLIGCITADSDGQHTPLDIKNCMRALTENPDNLILGCRNFSGDHIPAKSKFGNELTKKVCDFLCGIKVSDTQTGLRGIPREFMKKLLPVSGERFEFETNMLIECKDGIKITEVAIETIYDSKKDHKTHFDPIKDSICIYRIFGKIFFKYIFSSLSACVIDILLFAAFCPLFYNWDTEIYVGAATVFARIISSAYNYLVNYRIVFNSKEKVSKAAIKYFCLAAIQMCLSALFVTIGVKILIQLSEVFVKVIVDTCLFFISYHIQQKYVFRKRNY